MRSKQNLTSKLGRNGAHRSSVMAALLCCLFALCLSDKAAAQTNYSSGQVMRVSFTYYSVNPNCSPSVTENCEPQENVWRLNSGRWIGVRFTDLGSPTYAEIADSAVGFPIEVAYGQSIGGLPQTTRSKIHVDARLVLRPHYDTTGTLSQTVTAARTLGNSSSAFVFTPSASFYWLDQDVTLQVDVWCEGAIVTNPHTVSFSLARWARKSLFNQLSPYMTPVAIIGRPPGDQSWSRLTTTSGGGVGLALWQGASNSTTTQEGYGFGPFQHQEPEHTETRVKTRGVEQNLSFAFAHGFASNNPWGPGEGDMMFCVTRPTFAIYSGVRDMDFRYLKPDSPCQNTPTPTTCTSTSPPSSMDPPRYTIFPMRDLLNPQPLSPTSFLTASENAAFRALNPLLSDPHAVLPEPRYYHLFDLDILGGSYNTSVETRSFTRDFVENKMLSSSTYSQTDSVTIPLGAIAQLAGSLLPVPDFQYRSTETTTASTEIRTMKTLEGSSGRLVEYQIADSNPNRWLYVGIYYDTYFRTFAFRDRDIPLRAGLAVSIIKDYQIEKLQLKAWRGFRYEDARLEAPEFLVIGSLKDFGLDKGEAEFEPLDKSKPNHRVTVLPGTGNVLISDLKPGDYQITINNTVRLLRVSNEGYVTFE